MREKQQVTYKGYCIILIDFSQKFYRREWDDIFKVLKEKNLQPRIPSTSAMLLFRSKGEIKYFPNKNLKNSSKTRPVLRESTTLKIKV